jgi:hypothetical protein
VSGSGFLTRMSRDSLSGMTAQIGIDGLNLLGGPCPDLLGGVVRVRPEPGGEWANLERLGFRSTQRLQLTDLAGGVALVTYPAELQPQARYLYGGRHGSALVAAAVERGWEVEPRPHLAYRNARPSRRLYMRPPIAPLDYAACWEDGDGLRRVRSFAREDVEHELWPWLKQQQFADDGDDAVLLRFLDESLGRRPAHMRPGLQFRRVWTSTEASDLGPALAATIRSEFDAVFAIAREPALGSAGTAGPEARHEGSAQDTSAHAGGFAREAVPERVRHEVWRRDKGQCVDCGSRERLEFDHIIPVSRGGSNTARNIELRCQVCNRRKGATV